MHLRASALMDAFTQWDDPSEEENTVYYDAQSKTAFLINIDYYGWIKSLALSLAGDVLEDEHGIYSIHGACLDIRGKGICLLGESGAGKTTHTYGLLRSPEVRVVSDDWFYARIYGDYILAYGYPRLLTSPHIICWLLPEVPIVFEWSCKRSHESSQLHFIQS